MFYSFPPIILASQSPRRKNILENLGLPFEVMAADVEESYPAELAPERVATFLAEKKALPFKPLSEEKLLLAMDTIVCIGNQILGKPQNSEDAIQTLTLLSGKAHIVITGVCILWKKAIHTFAEKTTVFFNELTSQEIEYYVHHFKPYDKAGSYGAQDWMGLVAIQRVEGDFYNVLGLPANRLITVLKQLLSSSNV
jgi:septum formation protein